MDGSGLTLLREFNIDELFHAIYSDLLRQLTAGAGSPLDAATFLIEQFGDGAQDGWFEWLVENSEWTYEALSAL